MPEKLSFSQDFERNTDRGEDQITGLLIPSVLLFWVFGCYKTPSLPALTSCRGGTVQSTDAVSAISHVPLDLFLPYKTEIIITYLQGLM